MDKKTIDAGKLRATLAEYGRVELCEERDDTFHVKITEGFKPNARKTFECMGKILKEVGDVYPHVKKNIADDNIYELILKQ